MSAPSDGTLASTSPARDYVPNWHVRTVVKALVQGRAWWQELQADNGLTLEAIGRREGITSQYVLRIIRLAFLPPLMLDNITVGALPAHLTHKRLITTGGVAAPWDLQPN